MAFRDFTFPDVVADLGLQVRQDDLFSATEALPVRAEFEPFLQAGRELARVNDNEKARSEFVIALLLVELRLRTGGRFGLFSGAELDADRERGLNGVCDFILTASPDDFVPASPLVQIVEAKSNNLRTNYAQCIAAMVAAQVINRRAQAQTGRRLDHVHGVVSTGSHWQFLRLTGTEVVFDTSEYDISQAGKILGIFEAILRRAGVDLGPPLPQASQ